jgi:hypothetical protein
MGDTVTEIDAVTCGLLPNVMNVPISSPIKDEALSHSNLVAYVGRIERRFFR